MQRPVSSSDSSADDTGFQDFKAAQAANFRKLTGTPGPIKFKEAQVEGLKGDSIRHSTPKKTRPTSLDQTAASRTRSGQPKPTSAAQLLQLLASDNRETEETRKLLHAALSQLDISSRRLAESDAERRALESAQLAQTAQSLQTASAVQQNAAAAQAELSLYKLQMEHAQAEIARAQDVVRTLENQRDDAERAAAKARAIARKLHVEKMAVLAREEGRKEGYETGFGHGHLIAVAKEQRRLEQRRAEAEIRQRQIAPPMVAMAEPGGAFIEEHSSSGDDEARRDMTRGLADAPLPRTEPRAARPRDSLDLVRVQPQPEPEPTPRTPPTQTQPEPAPPPVTVVINNNPAPPPAQRRPTSSMSTSSSRRANAPPVVAPQQMPRSRTTSMDGSRTGSRAASRTGMHVSGEFVGAPNRTSTATPLQTQDPRRNSTASRTGMRASEEPVGAPSRTTPLLTQDPRRNSTASRNSLSNPNTAAGPNTAQHQPNTTQQWYNPAPHNNAQQQQYNTNAQQRPRRRSTSTLDSSDLGLGTGPRMMSMEAMMPRLVPMPPPPPRVPMPAPVLPPPPARSMTSMPQMHIPMPAPPPGATPVMPSAHSQPRPPLFSQPQQQPQFEVERPERRERERETRSPSSVATSLGTLRLKSFPSVGGGIGPGNEAGAGASRENGAGVGAGMGIGGGMGMGGGRERELSVILEHAEGSPAGSQLGNSASWAQQAWRAPGTRGSSPYSDPRGMEEWRRGTDEEAPRNTLPPPSPLTSPGLLSPFDAARPQNMHPQPSQESFRSDLRRSSSGSSSHTVNITIVPPSRPTSVGQSAGIPTQGSGGFLSPNHAHEPVVPEEDEEEDDDDDDDSDTSSAAGMPPGFVLGPLPAFAQGVTYPPGFVPMSIGPSPHQALPQSGTAAGAPMGPAAAAATPTWAAPPPMGANASAASQQPTRPLSRQMGGILGALAGGGSSWAASTSPDPNTQPVRPLSRQMGGQFGAPPGGANWATPTGLDPNSVASHQPPRPLSRQGGGLGATPWTAPPVMGANAMGPPQQPQHQSQVGGGAPGAANSNWSFAGAYTFGQNSTPVTQPPLPLDINFPTPTVLGVPVGAPTTQAATHAPQPTRPQSFVGTPHGENPALRPTTPRPIYAAPNPGNAATFGTGYPAPTPSVAAGYPLPQSVAGSSPATTTPHQRITSLNAGTTPAAFNTHSLSRPASRASSRPTSGGFSRYNNNQTPNPHANLGITNPYTSIAEEAAAASGSSGSSASTIGLDQTTVFNTYANMNAGAPVIPVIPPSPAYSYRPMR